MANKDEIIQHFIELTGADIEVANFYLDSSNWNIETALSSYYGNEGDYEEPDAMENSELDATNLPEVVNETFNNFNVAAEAVKPKKTQSDNRKIATLSSLKRDNSDDEDEERPRQAFYVGGSEHGGGQQVLGPPKDGQRSKDNNLESLFKSAQRHGAEVITHEEEDEHDSVSKPFSGSGFRLGDSTTVNVPVVASSSKSGGLKPIRVNVKIWSNGFSVDDGPLRSMTEPNNHEFLRALSVGQIPNELLQEHKHSKIDLNMEDHVGEDFKEPPKVKPFHGSGTMLGSPTPRMVSQYVSTTMVQDTLPQVVVNDNEPVTQIQVRLADNSRIVVRLNHSHTVGDVRQSIITQRPQYRSVRFSLLTTFPNKLLSDDSASLKDGNLLNSVLLQRLL